MDPSINNRSLQSFVVGVLDSLQLGLDVVVKRSDSLPDPKVGSDIDIFTVRPSSLIAEISKVMLMYQGSLGIHEMSITEVNSKHWHLDVVDQEGLLSIRFDIFGSIPNWTNYPVRSSFFPLFIGAAISLDTESCRFPIPSKLHEAIIRYFEYLNSCATGRLKQHHEEWILGKLSESELDVFWELVHFAHVSPSPEHDEPLRPLALQLRSHGLKTRVVREVRKIYRPLQFLKHSVRSFFSYKLRRR